MIIDHLNLHSIRNKFFDFEELAFNEIDICLISETKIDDSFETHNFLLTDIFFRRGRNRNGGGLILYVKENILKNEVLNLSYKKSNRKGDIPVKVLKDSFNIYSKEPITIINSCLEKGLLYSLMNFKKVMCRPFSRKMKILIRRIMDQSASYIICQKVFERLLYKHVDNFMESKFLPYLCGFKKNHISQHLLL